MKKIIIVAMCFALLCGCATLKKGVYPTKESVDWSSVTSILVNLLSPEAEDNQEAYDLLGIDTTKLEQIIGITLETADALQNGTKNRNLNPIVEQAVKEYYGIRSD